MKLLKLDFCYLGPGDEFYCDKYPGQLCIAENLEWSDFCKTMSIDGELVDPLKEDDTIRKVVDLESKDQSNKFLFGLDLRSFDLRGKNFSGCAMSCCIMTLIFHVLFFQILI